MNFKRDKNDLVNIKFWSHKLLIFLKSELCAGPNMHILHSSNINYRSPQDLYTVTLTAAMYSGMYMLFNRCTNARASLVCVVALLIKINVNAAPRRPWQVGARANLFAVSASMRHNR